MKDLLEIAISWKNVKKKPKGDFKYQIRRAAIEKSTNIFFLDVCFNFLADKDDEERIKALLMTQLPGLSQARVNLSYDRNLNDEGDLLRKNQGPQPGIILGRKINEKVSDIRDLSLEKDQAVIEGKIFDKRKRILRNGQGLITFLINDSTESACVRVRTPKGQSQGVFES